MTGRVNSSILLQHLEWYEWSYFKHSAEFLNIHHDLFAPLRKWKVGQPIRTKEKLVNFDGKLCNFRLANFQLYFLSGPPQPHPQMARLILGLFNFRTGISNNQRDVIGSINICHKFVETRRPKFFLLQIFLKSRIWAAWCSENFSDSDPFYAF